jgi:transcriptional regulator with XRE-family HTH domain
MPTSNTVEINGFLIRELRKRGGLSVVELAERIGVKRPYVAKIELGHSRRVSVKVFNALIATFAIEDHRALLAKPYGDDLAESA